MRREATTARCAASGVSTAIDQRANTAMAIAEMTINLRGFMVGLEQPPLARDAFHPGEVGITNPVDANGAEGADGVHVADAHAAFGSFLGLAA